MSKLVNKEEASALRKQGLTYKQIAETIGCSLDWCKKNLKHVEVDPSQKELMIRRKQVRKLELKSPN